MSCFRVLLLEININISVVIIVKIIATIESIRDHGSRVTAARLILLQQIIGLRLQSSVTSQARVHRHNTLHFTLI